VAAAGHGYRVIATGADGTLHIPANIAAEYPAALHVRLYGMNALGKVYTLDRNYTLNK
jgi:diacylglycerol kinase family enzyme